MNFSRWARWLAAVLLLGAGLCGCLPGADAPVDEEKEPHFLEGKKLTSQMDYAGAVDEYEKALEVNSQSAAAHFELACLYEGQENDPAAAIYHYERFLKLAPTSGKAEAARAHINMCKMSLAQSAAVIAPISASAQRDLEGLWQENRKLKGELAQWQAFYQSYQQSTGSNQPAQNLSSNGNTTRTAATMSGYYPGKPNTGTAGAGSQGVLTASRTHVIQHGDTLMAIAKKYGVTLAALESANPTAQPTRLPVGGVLNIPSM